MSRCLWLPGDSLDADVDQVGGKAASLARMARAGLPIPPGFYLTCAAYRQFIDTAGLQEAIAAVAGDDDGEATEALRERIMAAPLPAEVIEALAAGMVAWPANTSLAVRSSATAEDSPEASFAGQLESVLGVRGVDSAAEAVKRCWASLWSQRAVLYRARQGGEAAPVMGVVVQRLMKAEASGVMFTTDPATRRRDRIVINATWGLGETLVGGEVTPDMLVVDAWNGQVVDRGTGDKTVRTVDTADGTVTQEVPEPDRRREVLDDERARQLAGLGARVVQLDGQPADIEWCWTGEKFVLLQARPITGGQAASEEWNDSLAGDYLWTAVNLGEAVPNVMTPMTWSLMLRTLADAMAMPEVDGHRLAGNIGGRLYLNYSLMMDSARAVGMGKLMSDAASLGFGELPEKVRVPAIPMSRWRMVSKVAADAWRFQSRVRGYQQRLGRYLREYPGRCDRAREAIAAAGDVAQLHRLWREHCAPLFRDGPRMLAAGARVNGMALARMRPWLRRYVDETDVNVLASGNHGAETLASLGPLLGLRQLAAGEMSREEFARQWGHRCPDELELSAPRPGEDPEWIDRLLATVDDSVGVDALLERHDQARQAALTRFRRDHPKKVEALAKRTARAAEAIRAREATRSESVRCMWVLRDFVRRVGEVTGTGEDVFFLSIDEVLELLDGRRVDDAVISARRAAYTHYRSLPTYPTLIRGAFHPEVWARDPRRRHDIFDATEAPAPRDGGITGVAASAGVAEGIARVLRDPEDTKDFAPGDILVTKVTNIGWTPLFPRAQAVVTDIGAVLSHAAIVARELAIPAVVGCDDATVRIGHGDLIRVDGDTGMVELLQRADWGVDT